MYNDFVLAKRTVLAFSPPADPKKDNNSHEDVKMLWNVKVWWEEFVEFTWAREK